MAMKPLPSPDLLRQLLRYDPDTGKLYWRERPVEMFNGKNPKRAQSIFNTRYASSEALKNVNTVGYKNGNIFSKVYAAHRVIWALHYGEWPPKDIDHINGNRADNRIKNLRCVDRGTNCRNQKMRNANKSGVMGVMFEKERGKWSARIGHNMKTIHLGRFDTFEEAVAARKKAEKELGYHEHHGR